MTKVTMRPSRTAAAATAATVESSDAPFKSGATLTRTDARGRTVTFKQLSLMEEMDLLAVAGADNARNSRWMMYATMAGCVRSIDGEHLSPFANARLLRARIQQVGAEGIAVVAEVIAAENPQTSGEDDEASDVEAAAKN